MSLSRDVPSLGWTPRRVGATVLLAMEEHRKAVGMRIRALREAQGLSQEDLAHMAGVTTKTISRWENGRHSGYGGNLKALADALGAEQREILGDQPAPLGLGAREDQVESIGDEFREKVDTIIDRQDRIFTQFADAFTRLDAADADRSKIADSLATQDGLLQALHAAVREAAGQQRELAEQQKRSADLLVKLEAAVRLIPALETVLEQLGAVAEDREPQPEGEAVPPEGVERRHRERRQTG